MKYPHANFACGVTNLKLLTVSQWAGDALLSLIV